MSKLFPQLLKDELGDYVVLDVDALIFPASVVVKAAYWLTNRFYLYIDHSGAETLRVEIRPRGDTRSDALATVGAELSNKIVDFSVRAQVAEETRSVRDTLVAAAFSEGLKTRKLGKATSNESALGVPSTSDSD